MASVGGGGGAGADGVSPGNIPVYYGPGGRVPVALERRVRAAEVLMRCTACAFAVLAAALLATDRQSRVIFSFEKVARYTDMQSLVFLVIANGIAACYSLLQGARCLVSVLTGGVLVSRPVAWAIFSCDQVMAYFTTSAMAMAMEASLISQYGMPQFQWMTSCDLYKRFCVQAGVGLVCAVAASFNMVAIAPVSAFNLFRLYGGGGKGGRK